MARKKLVAGNWKMFKSLREAEAFVAALGAGKEFSAGIESVICAQAPLLPVLASALKAHGLTGRIQLGVQNIHWEEKGAFTGELSPLLAKEIGAAFALAGHSERRQFFGETDEIAVQRALAAHKHGMRAIFCVGERLNERDAGQTFAVLERQCAPLFAAAKQPPAGFVVAYEPVWAIGTGRTATAAQAQEAHAFLRTVFKKAWGNAGESLQILYGGSVKPENSKELMGCADVDGVLVGGASLEAAGFLAIAAAAG